LENKSHKLKPGLRKRFFAWVLKKSDALNHKLYGPFKRKLFQGLKGLVVEIGPGTGVNFNYFPLGIQWIGIEPNQAFHETLHQQALKAGIDAKILTADALNIPLPDHTADVLICTLVLCSIKDPAKTIAELKRVLKSGGGLIFIEHVAAPKKTGLRRAQNIFNPFNKLIADGCNCNRETWTIIENAGFKEIDLSHQILKGAFKLSSPHIIGYAVK
jgi:ubiquinone/menaquinone biosynthesis C-methylase UbiE